MSDEVNVVAEMRALVLLCVSGAQVPPSATIRTTLNKWADEIERLQEFDGRYLPIIDQQMTEITQYSAEVRKLKTEVKRLQADMERHGKINLR